VWIEKLINLHPNKQEEDGDSYTDERSFQLLISTNVLIDRAHNLRQGIPDSFVLWMNSSSLGAALQEAVRAATTVTHLPGVRIAMRARQPL
jgi:hypothetical protein